MAQILEVYFIESLNNYSQSFSYYGAVTSPTKFTTGWKPKYIIIMQYTGGALLKYDETYSSTQYRGHFASNNSPDYDALVNIGTQAKTGYGILSIEEDGFSCIFNNASCNPTILAFR